jgi:D-threo-aldose 1-dehydrogenase
MDPTALRTLGRTGVQVTQLGFGGATLGNLFEAAGDDQAQATLEAAWTAGLRYYDTAPWYGRGLSELRFGRFLRSQPRREFVLSTKVGRVLRAPLKLDSFDRSPWVGGLPFEVVFDYGYTGIMRAYEDSLQRLSLPRIELAIIHDLDAGYHAPEVRVDAYLGQLATGGFRALADLRDAGLIRGIGVGINEDGMIPRFLELFDVDFFLVAGRYTLTEQGTLSTELAQCVERGVGIVIGAVFNSGILATGAVPGARYNYLDPTPEQVEKVRRVQAVCERHGVPLAAAALQFPLGHPAVASVIPGPIRPEHVARNVATFEQPIPAGLWEDLKAEGLMASEAPVPA